MLVSRDSFAGQISLQENPMSMGLIGLGNPGDNALAGIEECDQLTSDELR